jgi:two-component system cell cycle sensor histidine kinase/response regulator CckA
MINIKKNTIEIETYEGIFNALGTAVIYYDHNGCLVNSNMMAINILPELFSSLTRFEDLISFVFEHSLDMAEQTDLSSSFQNLQRLPSFCEIIRLPDHHFYMVSAITQENKNTLVEISDISQIKNRTDDIKLLDRDNRILSQAIHSSQKGIFIAGDDDEKRIIFVNKSMGTLLGNPDESILGYRLDAFLSTYFENEWESISKDIAEHKNGRFWQKMNMPDGNFKWLLLNLSADKKEDNQNMIIGFISDETINKVNEQHILQTQKMDAIGKLAGGVAHDFNNILSIVEGYVGLSEIAIKRGDDVSENFQRIKKAVKRGSGLTRQLLMFGKHRVSENKIVDLCSQVKDVESFLEPLLGVNFKVHIKTPEYPIFVRASADAIYQIIMNLVINARDAMDGEGVVDICIIEENDDQQMPCAILSVTDTGCGMDEKLIPKIFDPFFTTKEQGKGTGLGLSMVYGVVKQIGAKIDVSSIPNEGTVFSIHFPIIDDIDCLGEQKNVPRGYNNLRGKTILVAEDEEDLLVIIKTFLEDFGMKVMSAKNGQDALCIQDEFEDKIDFLLTDIVMPKLGGLKLASLIREVRPETNIVFMSGYPDRGDTLNFELPSDAIFMAKPLQPDFLRDVLEKILAGESVNQTDAIVWKS